MEKEKDTSRRDFLKTSLAVGVGSLLGAAALGQESLASEDSPTPAVPSGQKVRVMTADGKVAEIDAALLANKRKCSEEELEFFMFGKDQKEKFKQGEE